MGGASMVRSQTGPPSGNRNPIAPLQPLAGVPTTAIFPQSSIPPSIPPPPIPSISKRTTLPPPQTSVPPNAPAKLLSVELLDRITQLSDSFSTFKSRVEKSLDTIHDNQQATISFLRAIRERSNADLSKIRQEVENYGSTISEVVTSIRDASAVSTPRSDALTPRGAEYEFTQGLFDDMDVDRGIGTNNMNVDSPALGEGMTVISPPGGAPLTPELMDLDSQEHVDGTGAPTKDVFGPAPFSSRDRNIFQPAPTEVSIQPSRHTPRLSPTLIDLQPGPTQDETDELLVTPPQSSTVDTCPPVAIVSPPSTLLHHDADAADKHVETRVDHTSAPPLLPSPITPPATLPNGPPVLPSQPSKEDDPLSETPSTPASDIEYEVYMFDMDPSLPPVESDQNLPTGELSKPAFVYTPATGFRRFPNQTEGGVIGDMEEELEVKEELISFSPPRKVSARASGFSQLITESSQSSLSSSRPIQEKPQVGKLEIKPASSRHDTTTPLPSPHAPASVYASIPASGNGDSKPEKRPSLYSPEQIVKRRHIAPPSPPATQQRDNGGSRKKSSKKKKKDHGSYLDRRLESQIVLRKSDGRKRGKGEWPPKGPNTRKGRLVSPLPFCIRPCSALWM